MSLHGAIRRLWQAIVDPTRETARRDDWNHVIACARARRPAAADVAAAWPIVLQALEHQGTPRGNLALMIDILKRGESHGWDEMDIEFETDSHSPKVELRFVDEVCSCDARALLAELEALAGSLDPRAESPTARR